MAKKAHLTLKLFGLIILNDAMDSVAQLLMKKGLSQVGISAISFSNIFEFGIRSLSSWLVLAGLSMYIASFILWLVIIYRIDLSIAMPLGSVAYAITPILAIIFLHETVSPVRWLGVGFIILGIYFTSQSKEHLVNVRAKHD